MKVPVTGCLSRLVVGGAIVAALFAVGAAAGRVAADRDAAFTYWLKRQPAGGVIAEGLVALSAPLREDDGRTIRLLVHAIKYTVDGAELFACHRIDRVAPGTSEVVTSSCAKAAAIDAAYSMRPRDDLTWGQVKSWHDVVIDFNVSRRE